MVWYERKVVKIHISKHEAQIWFGSWQKDTDGGKEQEKEKKPTGAQGNMKRSSSVDASSARYTYEYNIGYPHYIIHH